jgi:hypothetical protein
MFHVSIDSLIGNISMKQKKPTRRLGFKLLRLRNLLSLFHKR